MQQKDVQRYKKKLLEIRDRSRDEINRMIQVIRDDARAAGEHDREVSEIRGQRDFIGEHGRGNPKSRARRLAADRRWKLRPMRDVRRPDFQSETRCHPLYTLLRDM
jgi:hypothetical protein